MPLKRRLGAERNSPLVIGADLLWAVAPPSRYAQRHEAEVTRLEAATGRSPKGKSTAVVCVRDEYCADRRMVMTCEDQTKHNHVVPVVAPITGGIITPVAGAKHPIVS